MIGVAVPLRISFVGGGTDLPFFFNRYGGEVICVTINKFIYIFLNQLSYKNKILLKYSKTELVSNYKEIKNPLFREVLKFYKIKGIDINSIADMPSRSGLGSSSAFCVALVALIQEYLKNKISKRKIATIASEIEIKKLKAPIGYQDHYSSSYGGFKHIKFTKKKIYIKKIILKKKFVKKFENSIALIFTGKLRFASYVLKKQSDYKNILKNKKKYFELKNKVSDFIKALKNEDIRNCGKILKESWCIKKSINTKISNSFISEIEKKIEKTNPYGFKLLGAGNGGYFCVIANKKSIVKLKRIFKKDFFKITFDEKGVRNIKLFF
jgi:D-glycero-alpha-D-manno-heptose-7-phosphate kinase